MQIYAEISLTQQSKLSKSDLFLNLPPGVSVSLISGNKRGYYLDCDDDNSREELIEFLEENGINWQDN